MAEKIKKSNLLHVDLVASVWVLSNGVEAQARNQKFLRAGEVS